MTKENIIKETKIVNMPKIDLDKILNKAKAQYGKDKSLAAKLSTGASISRAEKDSDFICWKDSPWEKLTGVKGLPYGRICQISGRSNSGKSTHAMQFMAEAQKQGVIVILWDSENKFSSFRFSKSFHSDPDKLLLTTSKMILEGADQVEKLVHAIKQDYPDAKILIVWDSIGGTLANNEEEDSLLEGKQLAAHAKENGQVVKAFVRLMEKYKNKEKNEESIAVLLINQVYAAIGGVGSVEKGGAAIEYFSSLILQLTRKSDIIKQKDGEKIKTGIITRAKVKKNHLNDQETVIAELELTITAGGIALSTEKKNKESKIDDESDEGDE